MKTALVTGGAGFVGTNLIKRLIKMGVNVCSLDNYNTGLKSNHQSGARYIQADIRDMKNFSELGKFNIVYHMAAIARIQPSFDDPKSYFTTNANGTMALADWCASTETPIIYAGSSSKHSGRFKNPYTFSKDIGEDIIKLYQEHYNLKASIARFYNVYGPHQLLEGGYTTLIGRWIHSIKNAQETIVYGDGLQRRDFTHIEDIIDALILIEEKSSYGLDFELGRGRNYSVLEVAEMFGITSQLLFKPAKRGEARETLNTDKTAHEILGWNPKLNLEDYIRGLK